MGQMAVTCVTLLAVERTNPHPTETDDIFCNIYECNVEYSGRKKGEKEWRDMMVQDTVRITAGWRGGGWYRMFGPSRLLIMKKTEA